MNDLSTTFSIHEDRDGLSLDSGGTPPVRVRLRPCALEVHVGGEPGAEAVGFFAFAALLEHVSRGLLGGGRSAEAWHGPRAAAHRRAAHAVARPLREAWLRLLRRVSPEVLAVQRAVLAATRGDAALARRPALYEDRWLVRDVVAHPAAAIAVRHAWQLTGGLDAAGQLARLRDWKGLFSDIGECYRSLNRTLMNLPPRVPSRLVCELRHVHLERPLRDRLELLAVALYAQARRERAGVFTRGADHSRAVMHAGAARLREALARLAGHLGRPLDERRPGDVRELMRLLADYPERHAGDVVELTERAIRRELAARREPAASAGGEGVAGVPF